ncbi:MAG: tautomerase family protein, partial [Treponema sp.]|nr:tautomerase family protein [Treponema sp.]
MPLVKINLLKGKTDEYKKTIFDCVHQGLIEALGISDWDRFQRIIEFDRSDFEAPAEKSDNFMIIELTIFPSRTKEQKKSAIEIITSKLVKALSIAPEDVFIIINEPPLENWGMAG